MATSVHHSIPRVHNSYPVDFHVGTKTHTCNLNLNDPVLKERIINLWASAQSLFLAAYPVVLIVTDELHPKAVVYDAVKFLSGYQHLFAKGQIKPDAMAPGLDCKIGQISYFALDCYHLVNGDLKPLGKSKIVARELDKTLLPLLHTVIMKALNPYLDIIIGDSFAETKKLVQRNYAITAQVGLLAKRAEPLRRAFFDEKDITPLANVWRACNEEQVAQIEESLTEVESELLVSESELGEKEKFS